MSKWLDSQDLGEWMAYYRLQPFGDDMRDYMIAQLTALVANIARGKPSRSKPTDWLPLHQPHQQTPEEMKAVLRSVLDGLNNR